ncbi:MAG: hypothetical protein ACLFS9_03780 [Nitriliruptoraceae bacterium]
MLERAHDPGADGSEPLRVRAPLTDHMRAEVDSRVRALSPEPGGRHHPASSGVLELVERFAAGAGRGAEVRVTLVGDEEDLYLRMSAGRPYDEGPIVAALDRFSPGGPDSVDLGRDAQGVHVVVQRPWSATGR